ncbi:hypothetical protein ACP70R_043545 [Stipagrostis hirtigluma subsp. patula]
MATTTASMLMRAARDAAAASRAARSAAAAASRSGAASRAARSATAAASRAARSAASATSRAARSGPSLCWKRRDDEAPRRSKPPLPYLPGKSVTEKDLESDEAAWALYERWCEAYNKELDHAEMARRFDRFKQSVRFVLAWNKAFVDQEAVLGEFADAPNYARLKELRDRQSSGEKRTPLASGEN